MFLSLQSMRVVFFGSSGLHTEATFPEWTFSTPDSALFSGYPEAWAGPLRAQSLLTDRRGSREQSAS